MIEIGPDTKFFLQHNTAAIRAVKVGLRLRVKFATEPTTIQTLEGTVFASIGDAIITGLAGEQWVVDPKTFQELYCPVINGKKDVDHGWFYRKEQEVFALRLGEPASVILPGERGRITGEAGDWLVETGGRTYSVVAETIFDSLYQKI